MMRKVGLLVGMLLLLMALVAPLASAERLFGTTSTGSSGSPATSTLVELNPDDGSLIATIGDIGYAVNGMTWDETTDTLYATTSNWDPLFPSGLITIDPATAAGTPIGSGAGQNVNIPASNSAGQLYGWTENGDDAVIWDKAAGTIAVLGESGTGTSQTGLAFDASNILYLVNSGSTVYTINTTTGAATLLGPVAGVGSSTHHGDFHPDTNLYYGIEQGSSNLRVINIATLTLQNTIPTVANLHTMTFLPDSWSPPPAPSIPTLSEWGMILMGLILAGLAFVTIRGNKGGGGGLAA